MKSNCLPLEWCVTDDCEQGFFASLVIEFDRPREGLLARLKRDGCITAERIRRIHTAIRFHTQDHHMRVLFKNCLKPESVTGLEMFARRNLLALGTFQSVHLEDRLALHANRVAGVSRGLP